MGNEEDVFCQSCYARVSVPEKQHYQALCRAVAELCDLAGAKPEHLKDVWTLKFLIEELKRKCSAETQDERTLIDIRQIVENFRDHTIEDPHVAIDAVGDVIDAYVARLEKAP